MLHFRHGVLEGSLEALGVKRHTVEILDWEPARQLALYRVRWEA